PPPPSPEKETRRQGDKETEGTLYPISSQLLAGKTFVVTGTLLNYGRKEVEQLIAELGGKAAGSVSKNTAYVVAGDDAGSKLDRARELNVPVLSEEEFVQMVADLRARDRAEPARPAAAPAPEAPVVAAGRSGTPLAGMTIVVTGTL